jgi:CDP-diglyceride synthetase
MMRPLTHRVLLAINALSAPCQVFIIWHWSTSTAFPVPWISFLALAINLTVIVLMIWREAEYQAESK